MGLQFPPFTRKLITSRDRPAQFDNIEDCDPSRPHADKRQLQPSKSNENAPSPLPAHDHAMSLGCTFAGPIENDEDEEDHDVYEEEPSDSSSPSAFTGPSLAFQYSSDDVWVEQGPNPTRQVDYLSHDWQEPDIWLSWRYIRKEKAGYLQNATRLENASWRNWAKSRSKLETIAPEALNWFIIPFEPRLIGQVERL